MRGITYDELNVGDKADFSKTITESDIHSFSAISGDFNPIHVDEVYATTSTMGRKMQGRIAQGMLTASLFSGILAMQLPGKGTVYLSQTCIFKAPVKLGDTVTAQAEVVEKLEKGRVRLAMTATNQNGIVVVEGEALVIAPREA